MPIKALRFKLEEQKIEIAQEQLTIKSADDILKLKENNPRTAFVIEAGNLRTIAKNPAIEGGFIDLELQRENWELARSMLNQEKVPVIEAKYASAARLRYGVKSLLNRAAEEGDGNIYFVGAKSGVFQELWEQADPAMAGGQASQGKISARGIVSGNLAARILLDMLPPSIVPQSFVEDFVGNSAEIDLVRRLALKAARSIAPVMILGETGTGKELVARNIHRFSERRNRLFVSINCSAIPRELLELELFGCEPDVIQKGYLRKIGLWEYANDGTLFLDEIGDLSPDHQVKILRAVAENKIRRVGGLEDIPVSARIISATNRDLFQMVQAGTYRRDLYYRLRGFLISTPSLRDHPNDIPIMANKLWSKFDKTNHRPLTNRILQELRTYNWLGNVRELKELLAQAKNVFGEKTLSIENIRALRLYEKQMVSTWRSSIEAEAELEPHWMDRLRHLRRLEEFIRALQHSLQAFFESRRLNVREYDSIRKAFRNRRDELDSLFQSRQFLAAKASRALEEFKAAFVPLQELVETSIQDAFKNKDTAKRKMDRVLHVTRREAAKILREL